MQKALNGYTKRDPGNPAKNCSYIGKVGGRKRGNCNALTSERFEYTQEELEFLKAIQKYKEEKHRPHPSWVEVLEVFKSLGYRKELP